MNSASKVTTLWLYTNLFIIIIITVLLTNAWDTITVYSST